MSKQMKNTIGILATGIVVSLVTGCGQGPYGAAGEWEWTPPAQLSMNSAPANRMTNNEQLQARPMSNAGSSGAVIMSPGAANPQAYAYNDGYAPEYDRRDGAMNVRSTEMPLSMGFEGTPRTSLDNMRVFYTSNNPNRYAYPSTTPNQWNGHSSSGSYPGGRHTQSYGYVYEYGYSYEQSSGRRGSRNSRDHGNSRGQRPSNPRPSERPSPRR